MTGTVSYPVSTQCIRVSLLVWLGTHDGAFLVEKKIAGLTVHMASRDLALRKDRQALRKFYELAYMCQQHNSLPYMAQYGLLVRIQTISSTLILARSKLNGNE